MLLITIQPHDNAVLLIVRRYMATRKDRWMSKSPAFPIEMDDVGIIIKTGFSSRERLLAQSDILRIGHSRGNIVIIGDYSSVPGGHPSYDNLQAPVYDVLAIMIEDGSLSSRLDAARLQHYHNLTAALSGGNLRLAREIGKNHRLQLDIMKVSYILVHF
jgi:hypothetical protein